MRRLGEILDLSGSEAALADCEISGLCVDSRKAEPGDVFFAVAGDKADGLAYAAQAAAKGASVIVVIYTSDGGYSFTQTVVASAAGADPGEELSLPEMFHHLCERIPFRRAVAPGLHLTLAWF